MSAPQESWYPDLWDHSGASGSFSSNAALLSILNFKLEQRLILKTVIARRAAAHQVAALPVAEGAGHVLACSADHGGKVVLVDRLTDDNPPRSNFLPKVFRQLEQGLGNPSFNL